ncbi:U7 snRNA-associated Sm-like protein LSm10 [Trichoplax sp. H2]|uniref:Sm domain-containing protein n=1 Tax=Trichoplax adhaerens TaxID=10228 RepID=B3RWD7_TRIAD|nr:hypothetical protein TRIADDRAFT_24947 [Trichoplax adhaerens]EDV24673.1 hypothetical protein TRIADDRAFT_24947 [Trichoplax adhaerens]RDD41883.1 U7 snRNA-associated Sm-like protein LSm10 [Trichoplax sp. H2]|eukprot:XP_002112563.1 hypothetical protein TRIADDRAFT_24947 [Trichoplax adhaerens]
MDKSKQQVWLSIREQKSSENTLLCLLQGLQGVTTIIELVNEQKIHGKIDSVDGYSNVTMSDADILTLNGKRLHCPMIFIQGRKIRYAHIPPHIDISKTINRSLGNLRRMRANIRR